MKKAVSVIIALVMIFSLAGCAAGGESKGGAAKGEGGEVYEVAVIVRLTDMYGAWLKAAYEGIGANYDNLNVTVMDNQNENAKNMELLENCIQQQYDYIIIQSMLGDQGSTYQSCLDAGIKMISINMYQEWIEDYAAQVTVSEFDLGYTAATEAAENLPENAKVCILDGPAGMELTEERHRGAKEGLLDARPDVTLLDTQDGNFDKDTAMQKTEDWIQLFDDIDGVIAASDSMALGAIEAFKSSGVDISEVQFYGIDGLSDACQAILNGDMTGSVLQDAVKYAEVSLDLVSQDVAGEIDLSTAHENHSFDPVYISKENAQDQLDYFEKNGLAE